MSAVRSLWLDITLTLLRVLPFPCRTGLRAIGHPDRGSPVLLTCNFRLTVDRIRRALRGVDAHLLVANSRGVNVWCAATGGLLTNHDVISVLKTSGIDELVDHRHVILPQLAATGIEGKVVHEKTGWSVIWGPVYAEAIPEYLGRGLEKTPEMRSVSFPWTQRLEMAVAWAFPLSLLTLALLPFWPEGVLPAAALVWAASFLVFLAFPLYERYLGRKGKGIGFVFFDFGERGIPLIVWGVFLLGVAGYSALSGGFSWTLFLRWGLVSLIVLLLLGLDLTGSTPTYKGGLHPDRLLRIVLDAERCRGPGFCEQVCPRDVLEVDRERHLASLPRVQQCVQCGACIVQCPFDALFFADPNGAVIPPATVREFKLNLLGTRRVRV